MSFKFNPITLIAKAELVKPNDSSFKAVAGQVKAKYGFDIKPQIDLLYVRSCLVTTGMNDNDDIFSPEDTWIARYTPVMKPANWQHQEKNIVGVVYSTEACKLNGEMVDFNVDHAPNEPFEFWTESVVFKLIHPELSKEIEERAAKGNLFVSMEAWFDDYNYALVDDNKSISKLIARNSDTAFLDKYLRTNGGTGKYDNLRIGRSLKNITFGGYGFVDIPANKRSVIDSVLDLGEHIVIPNIASNLDNENDLIRSLFSEAQEKEDMTLIEKVTANDTSVDANKIADTVLTKLEADRQAKQARRNAKKAEEATAQLVAKASESEAALKDKETKVTELDNLVKANSAKAAKLSDTMVKVSAALDQLIKEVAGATDDTPPEIKAIDSAIAEDSGDAVFNAKLAWLTKSMGSLAEKAAKADEMAEQIAQAGLALREQEIRSLFADVLATEEIEVLVRAGLEKTAAHYEEWLEEKRFFVAHLKGEAAKKGKMSKKDEEKNPKEKEPDEDEDDAAKASRSLQQEFANLLNGVKEGTESDLSSGVNAGSLRVPKCKIAGAKEVADEVLDGATAEKTPNFRDAKGGSEGEEEENGFKALAQAIIGGNDKKERPAKAKAAFDPVAE